VRQLKIARSGVLKLRQHQRELKKSDLDGPIKSLSPGEWCIFLADDLERGHIGYVNPFVEDKYPCVYLVSDLAPNETEISPQELIRRKITQSFAKRQLFSDYEQGSRLFYGESDGLPGLIIDSFISICIIQINTAGLDTYRDFIQELTQSLTGKKALLLDNQIYREREQLPVFAKPLIPDLEISENGYRYHVRSEVIQKVGFYYDHRENRKQLGWILSRLKNKPSIGLDLFCYTGAWGINALGASVKEMVFVDQGNFSAEIDAALNLNHFTGRGKFHRLDVFKFLDQAAELGNKFDLILCDPPAFAKGYIGKFLK
jgi:23S rRNA (cytosine1962-C5)-methyltransferase